MALSIPVLALAASLLTPAPDRSAEPQLRALFDSMGKLRNSRMMVVSRARESEVDGTYPENMIEIWYAEPGRFRMQLDNYWGESMQFVSDGKTFLSDPLDDTQPIVLREAKKPIFENDPALAFRGNRVSPLYYLLAGRNAFDKLVDKKGEIVPVSGEGGLSGVRFKSPELGMTSIFFEGQKNLAPVRIQYDNIPARERLHQQIPQWVGPPNPGQLVTEDIIFLPSAGFAADAFSTAPAKGRAVIDQRKRRKP